MSLKEVSLSPSDMFPETNRTKNTNRFSTRRIIQKGDNILRNKNPSKNYHILCAKYNISRPVELFSLQKSANCLITRINEKSENNLVKKSENNVKLHSMGVQSRIRDSECQTDMWDPPYAQNRDPKTEKALELIELKKRFALSGNMENDLELAARARRIRVLLAEFSKIHDQHKRIRCLSNLHREEICFRRKISASRFSLKTQEKYLQNLARLKNLDAKWSRSLADQNQAYRKQILKTAKRHAATEKNTNEANLPNKKIGGRKPEPKTLTAICDFTKIDYIQNFSKKISKLNSLTIPGYKTTNQNSSSSEKRLNSLDKVLENLSRHSSQGENLGSKRHDLIVEIEKPDTLPTKIFFNEFDGTGSSDKDQLEILIDFYCKRARSENIQDDLVSKSAVIKFLATKNALRKCDAKIVERNRSDAKLKREEIDGIYSKSHHDQFTCSKNFQSLEEDVREFINSCVLPGVKILSERMSIERNDSKETGKDN